MRNLKRALCISMMFFGAVLFCFGSTSQVHALAILKLSDGTTTVVVKDDVNVSATNTANDGFVEYIGAVGSFTVNVSSGTSSNQPADPVMNLTSSNVLGVGILTMQFTDTIFDISSTTISSIMSSLGGTTFGLATVSVDFYYDSVFFNDDLLDGGDVLFASFGPLSGVNFNDGAFIPDLTTPLLPSNPFSLTILATVAHTDLSASSNFHANIDNISANGFVNNPVPEPSTILLFGLGLAGLGSRFLYKRRSLNRKRMEV